MPYENEHSCRLKEPSGFKEDSFFREERKTESGKKYDAILGPLKSDESIEVQAYRYPIEDWSESEAKSDCESHKGILFEPAIGSKEAKPEDPKPENPKKQEEPPKAQSC